MWFPIDSNFMVVSFLVAEGSGFSTSLGGGTRNCVWAPYSFAPVPSTCVILGSRGGEYCLEAEVCDFSLCSSLMFLSFFSL